MSNNIKKDLLLFNKLINHFLDREKILPPNHYIEPQNLHKFFDISLNENPNDPVELENTLKELLEKSPKSSSKLFFNQLYGGRHSKAVLGDLLAVFLNNSMATYKIAGPQVAIEKEVLSKIYNLIGYGENSGGTFPTGGSMCNFMSLVLARDKALKNSRYDISKLIVYTSENSHYSISKNVSLSGIKKENIRYLNTNKFGKIKVVDFKKQIAKDKQQGLIPFYLNATAGTTVLCAFDDIVGLAPICNNNNIWLHLDGAFGGTVIFSDKYKFLVKGIEQTDSFCFNAHKTLGAPISTSVLTVKNKQYLYESFDCNADYLYQTHDKEYNLGHLSLECGRRNNALKFWTLWKSIGRIGIKKIIDQEFNLANVARKYVEEHPHYKLYSFKNSLSICFNYKNFDPEDLCKKLYEKNKLMIGFGTFKKVKFIRLITINCQNTENEVLNVFKIIEEFTKDPTVILKTIKNE